MESGSDGTGQGGGGVGGPVFLTSAGGSQTISLTGPTSSQLIFGPSASASSQGSKTIILSDGSQATVGPSTGVEYTFIEDPAGGGYLQIAGNQPGQAASLVFQSDELYDVLSDVVPQQPVPVQPEVQPPASQVIKQEVREAPIEKPRGKVRKEQKMLIINTEHFHLISGPVHVRKMLKSFKDMASVFKASQGSRGRQKVSVQNLSGIVQPREKLDFAHSHS